jgi:hypothetical protein
MIRDAPGAELEQRKTKLIAEQGDMPDCKAERIIRGSAEWMDRLRMGCEARSKANLIKVQLEYIKLKHSEWIMHNAAERRELINRGF